MARLGTKGPRLRSSEAAGGDLLDSVSKAALVDLYLQALAATLGACDTPPSWEQVMNDANPTLRLRGDRPLQYWTMMSYPAERVNVYLRAVQVVLDATDAELAPAGRVLVLDRLAGCLHGSVPDDDGIDEPDPMLEALCIGGVTVDEMGNLGLLDG
jgi:hypothetical protein